MVLALRVMSPPQDVPLAQGQPPCCSFSRSPGHASRVRRYLLPYEGAIGLVGHGAPSQRASGEANTPQEYPAGGESGTRWQNLRTPSHL